MTILFHPCYDTRCRLDPAQRGPALLDTLTLGPLGLLQELELRLGLTAATTSNLLRTVDYVKLLRDYFPAHPDSPFASSFEADEFNVAAELLRWRDLLRLAGWPASMRGISARIDLLADLEPGFQCPALGDRWQAVLEELPKHRLTDWTLELHAPKQLLFPLYGRLIDRLGACGVRIRESVQQATRPEQVRRIRVRDFTEAFRGIPTLDPKRWTLICSHGKLLNNVLRLNGCPTTESSIRENDSSVVQLFEAGFSLFIHPSEEVPEAVDIYRLLNYLQARPNPIPARINLALQRLLTSEAGIDPECWQATIDEAMAADDEADEEARNRIRRRLDTLLNPFFEAISPRAIPLDRLRTYACSLRGWALQRSRLGDEASGALPQLAEMCDVMLALLETCRGETIDGQLLQGWISSIRIDASIRNTEAQIGSFDVVEHPAALVDPIDRAVWVDCVGMPESHYDFEFLGPDERKGLERQGVRVWSRTEEMKVELELIRRGVGQVRRELILITPESDRGARLEEHPIVDDLRGEGLTPFPVETDTVLVELPPLCRKMPEFRIAVGKIAPRETESATSLELLIQRPFDYVMKYTARLRPGGVRELDELNLIEGRVAHRTLELIVRQTEGNLNAMSGIIARREDFDRYFLKAVRECGLGLLLARHAIERKALQEQLRNALSALMQILLQYGLRVEGVEQEASAPLLDAGKPQLTVRVDLLLRNRAGNPVIFDLKWSRNEKRYEAMIREGRDLQLRVYDHAVSSSLGCPVAATGYFLLGRGQLLSADLPDLRGYVKQVDAPRTTAEAMARIRAGYERRYEEFRDGIIEEGEGLPVGRLPYARANDPERLWPLLTEKNGESIIKQIDPYDNAYRIFKGTLK
ncbi:PD-(D/E)XK nuclease family protein [uncultured Alistipes sp.]|uniref:PD-(D/E)XK nuclease family protein n=1 Tax=uncultured Alistipes sp. TaxID=538949 RepID=UPI002803D568|nr:PD-(D/E)XK nuclease family protein [uncultured Alistipes sp.]